MNIGVLWVIIYYSEKLNLKFVNFHFFTIKQLFLKADRNPMVLIIK